MNPRIPVQICDPLAQSVAQKSVQPQGSHPSRETENLYVLPDETRLRFNLHEIA